MEFVYSSGLQAVRLIDRSVIMWSSLQNLICVLLAAGKGRLGLLLFRLVLRESKGYRKYSIRVKFEYYLSEEKSFGGCSIFQSMETRAWAKPSCLHKQMKLTSVHSIGSFYTSHFISIIPLSITLREGWNLSLVDESERIEEILFGLYPVAQVLVISPTAPWRWPIRARGIVDVTFVGGQFHVVKVAFNFNRGEFDGFLFEALWKLCVKGTHSLIPTPRQVKEAFTVDESVRLFALHQRTASRA